MKRLVLLGGGHSNVEVLRAFRVHPAGVCVTLVDPARFAAYSGMLPGLVAGHYGFHDCHIDLAGLARGAGAHFVQARACGIDAARRKIELDDGAALDFDLISLDVGSVPASAGLPGIAEHAIPVRPVATFLHDWTMLIERAQTGTLGKLVLVGGGAAGVELILAMQYRLAQVAPPKAIQFALVTDADRLLPGATAGTRAALQCLLARRGIAVHLNARVTRVEPGAVVFLGDDRVAADAAVWATGAGAPAWLRETGLMLDDDGFILVNEHLQSVSRADVFAAGDCATMVAHAYPKSGVYAVRQGPILAENVRQALAGKPLAIYRPQRRALALISGGDKYAVASYGNFTLAGAWVWRWKNHIDRRFVARYRVVG